MKLINFFRRLSSKTREQTLSDISRMGVENRGFQQDNVPKSPWRYPFRRTQVPPMQRTVSQDSTSTIASAANIAAQMAGSSTQSLRRETLSRMLPPYAYNHQLTYNKLIFISLFQSPTS